MSQSVGDTLTRRQRTWSSHSNGESPSGRIRERSPALTALRPAAEQWKPPSLAEFRRHSSGPTTSHSACLLVCMFFWQQQTSVIEIYVVVSPRTGTDIPQLYISLSSFIILLKLSTVLLLAVNQSLYINVTEKLCSVQLSIGSCVRKYEVQYRYFWWKQNFLSSSPPSAFLNTSILCTL
jgi:hypothetical protein